MSHKKKKNLNKSHILFFSLISLLLVLSVSLTLFQPTKAIFWGSVLGDRDENEGDDKDKNEQENENEDEEEDDKNDGDDKDESENKEHEKESRTVTLNNDGTRTVMKTKVDDNGKVEVETKTYSTDGKILEEAKAKAEGQEAEVEYEAKNKLMIAGTIKELKFKSKNNEEFKLMVKNSDGGTTKVKYDDEHNYVQLLNQNSQSNVIVRNGETENEYEIEHLGSKTQVKLPITVNEDTGEVLLLTDSGEQILSKLPDEIENEVESNGSSQIINSEVEEEKGTVVYKITSEQAQNILGIFNTQIRTLATYDATSGEKLATTQDFWNKVLDLISF